MHRHSRPGVRAEEEGAAEKAQKEQSARETSAAARAAIAEMNITLDRSRQSFEVKAEAKAAKTKVAAQQAAEVALARRREAGVARKAAKGETKDKPSLEDLYK